MGSLKQLLPYRGSTLIEHAIEQAGKAGFFPVIVVLGAQEEAVRAVLATHSVEIVRNEHWQLGMGSSIAAGMRRLAALETDRAAVAILLADQPLITADHLIALRRLLHTQTSRAVAAEYDGTLGVPALFKRDLFQKLQALRADAGARSILREGGIDVSPFPLPEAAVDIDTPDDFAALHAHSAPTS